MLKISLLRKTSPQLEISMCETSRLVSMNFLKSAKLRNPTPSVLPVSPEAVGQLGHLSWQAVAVSSRTLRGLIGVGFMGKVYNKLGAGASVKGHGARGKGHGNIFYHAVASPCNLSRYCRNFLP